MELTSHNGCHTICLVAGDVSGDQNAGRLAAAIRQLTPDVRLVGVGGVGMREAGVEVLVETTDLSFVGVLNALPLMRQLILRYRQAQRLIAQVRPDVAVLVDSEAISLPAALWLRRKRVPVVFFFPPQVWFWGRWRLRTIAPLARRVLSAFRREADLYAAAGVDTRWVGHPLRDLVQITENPEAALRAVGLDPARPLVVLMPGSRLREIRGLTTPFLGAARLLRERDPNLQFAIPLASESFRGDVETLVQESGLPGVVIYRPKSYAVLSRAQVILQCSGTATLEAALLGIPSVIVYRLHPVEYFVGRHLLINVDFIGMPNILLGGMVQPEFFNTHLDAEHLAEEAWSLLTDLHRRSQIQSRLAAISELLGPPGAFRRAASGVVDLLPPRAVELPLSAAS